ncbi:MAG: NADH-quinone oxidoreductase subunit L [Planctomycetes bacterium]|nr:NADH-quinone oxidoreductase subunit L [Planctomycetota bacterium]
MELKELVTRFIWLIPAAPLAGFIINGLWGRRFSKNFVTLIGCLGPFIALLVSIAGFRALSMIAPAERADGIVYTLYNWISAGSLHVDIQFIIDPLSSIMLLVVTGVGFLIHLYSIGYMGHDKGYSRYFAFLNLFMFAMLILVLANNLLMMFIGWEGVGLCSYLLIGFWFEDNEKASAGKKAFIVNRIGDFGFILAIFLIFTSCGTLTFSGISEQAKTLAPGVLTAIAILLFVGATGKSAQIPLYVWLPDAMAGPTPVSALIHAATMVTAGVYMVGRMSAIYVNSPEALIIVSIIGGLTALYAATIGLVQNDIKKVLAYSTISQLGYMFLGMGVMAFSAGIFHLVTHAFFKALLFLCAGSVIHAMSGEQDMRKMGGLWRKIPVTFACFVIGAIAIAGVPPFAGFFSKDEILWKTLERYETTHAGLYAVLWVIGLLSALMTAFYMFRLIAMTFFGAPRANEEIMHHVHESPFSMTSVLVTLAILSLIGGFIGVPHLLGGHNWIEGYLEPVWAHPESAGAVTTEAANHSMEIINIIVSVLAGLAGILGALLIYTKFTALPAKLTESNSGKFVHRIVYNKYYIDEIYNALVIQPIKYLSALLWLIFDMAIIDGGLVDLSATLIAVFSQLSRRIQNGIVNNYAMLIFIGAILMLCFFVAQMAA